MAHILGLLDLASPSRVTRQPGGSNAVFRIDLSDGSSVNLKTYDELRGKSPEREARAAGLLQDAGVNATRYLLVDESRNRLPYRFALVSHLSGQTIDELRHIEPMGLDALYRQMGVLLREIHGIALPRYGAIDEGPEGHRTNSAFVSAFAASSLEQFEKAGGNIELAARLRAAVRDQLEIAAHSSGAVLAHNDFHPGNVIADCANGSWHISGLIDFGNAIAADPLFDLAKALFCTEHMAPGAGTKMLDGYGPIDHPDPKRTLWLYTLLHRVSMWAWLRHTGAIASSQHNILIDDLEAMLAEISN
ncbi:hypothetical protein VW35_17305 [Devosia soli]|uniref:Aminoglycoside phosphotransferase domain-containing protein n=1 Tax=Devosia soli TaxID=361041 RepID=A0A0F5L550_9HYPH|nr:hypothetical protein VW35_17305 [Devosia soli]